MEEVSKVVQGCLKLFSKSQRELYGEKGEKEVANEVANWSDKGLKTSRNQVELIGN